jgi:hypothetical protein
MDSSKETYTVKEIADLAGVSTSALRAWERRFSIFSPLRTVGGHRLYTLDDLRIIWFVKRQQDLGKDLREISEGGHTAILAKANLFFSTHPEEIHPAPTAGRSYVGDIITALKANDIVLAIKILREASTLFTSPQKFVSMIIRLDAAIDEISNSISPFLRNAIRSKADSLLLFRIEQTEIPPGAPLAVASLLSSKGSRLKTLCALLLARGCGFNTLFLHEAMTPEELRDFIILGKAKCLLVGLTCAHCGEQPLGTYCPDLDSLVRKMAPAIAPYAITVLVPEFPRHATGADQTIVELQYMHMISNWETYLELMRFAVRESSLPQVLLSEFNKRLEKKETLAYDI